LDIGKKIKQAREASGLSQSELSAQLKLHQVTIARWECEARRCSFENLKKISEITEKPIGWFFGEDHPAYTYDRSLREELLVYMKRNNEELHELKELVTLMGKRLEEGESKKKQHNRKTEKR
jgi:transcriptional regulator with XRE-family HTH domain